MTEYLAAIISTALIFGWWITAFIPATQCWYIHCTETSFMQGADGRTMNTSPGRVMSRDCSGETRRSYYGQRLLRAVLLTAICQPHIKLWEYGTTCQEISRSLFIVNKDHLFFPSENKTEDAMKACKVSTMASRENARSHPLWATWNWSQVIPQNNTSKFCRNLG